MKSVATIPDCTSIPSMISQVIGNPVSALALVCEVGEGAEASVTAFITPSGAALSERFRHAIEMEGAYSDTLLSFDDTKPPYYGAGAREVDLPSAARTLGVERVLCLVTLDESGSVYVTRNYDGLEVTLLEAANTHLGRFREILDGVAIVATRRLQ